MCVCLIRTAFRLGVLGSIVLTSTALADDESANDRQAYEPGLTTQTVVFWQKRTERDPKGHLEWRELAGAYLARQRETGDIADAVNAENAARRSLAIQERRNATARQRLSRSLLAQHRFPEALKEALEAAKSDASAQRLVADIQLELGDVAAAERALALSPQGRDDLNFLALSARIDEAHGRHDAVLTRLREACAVVDGRPDMPAETAGWTYTMLGHALIDSGQLDDGRSACQKALAIFPADYRAMTGLAEAAAIRREWKDAEKWSRKALDVSGQNPEALRILAEALEGQGDHAAAKQQEARFAALCASFPRIYDRHWILFCADAKRDLDRALELARKDLDLRKDPGAYETLAWVAFQKGDTNEARRQIDKALASGHQTAPLYYHAGVIAAASGEADRAAVLMKRAESLNSELYKALTAR